MTARDKVISIIAHGLQVKEEDVTDDKSLEDLGADELDKIEFIMALEEEFKIEISEEDSDKFVTIKDVVIYIEAKTA